MKFSITGKLILIIGSLSVTTLTVMFLLSQYKFRSDLIAYINDQTEARLQDVAELAIPYYEINQSWAPLRRQPRLWRQTLTASDLFRRDEEVEPSRAPNNLGDLINDGRNTTDIVRSSITLLDSDRQFVAGENRRIDRSNSFVEPIVLDGTTIGYVVAPIRTQVIDRIDQQFVSRQLRSNYTIGLFVLALVLVITAFVVHRMVKPLLQLKQGTQMLTEGDYSARVKLKGRDELGELAADFNQLATTLETNRTNQRRWVSDISHELRTPIAILRGELETMQAGIKPADGEGLASLEEEVGRLTRLVDDLYLLSLTDAQEISYYKEQIDARVLIDQVITESKSRAAQCEMRVEWLPPSQPAPIYVDSQRVLQVLHNILENSFRYSGANTQVRFSVAQTRNEVLIEIDDSGTGVSDEQLQHLFERLYRADQSRNRHSGGSGLGLSICKGIIEDHSGTISADHSSMGGLCVRIALPLMKAE